MTAIKGVDLQVKPDSGDPVAVQANAGTLLQRVAPGEKDLRKAEAITLETVAAGDRVLVTLEDGTANLRRLIVMSANDITKRREADRLDWQKRGVSGIVVAKTETELTLRTRSMGGETKSTVIVSGKTSYSRYAPDSIKFDDAKPSALADLRVGDQVRARGVKSEDGSQVTAEDVVFGTFVTKAGKISAVDIANGEIAVAELGTNKPLVIRVTAASQLKSMGFPGMGGGIPGGGMPGGVMPGGGMPGGGMLPGGGGMPGGMPAGMRPPDIGQMIERMPPAQLQDLKPGDSIVVSSTKGNDPGHLTAILLVANADMLIRLASMQAGGAAGQPSQPGMPPAMGGGGAGLGGGLEGLQIPGMVP